jgi:hypothetical protein
MISHPLSSRDIASISQPHVVSNPATDEENDGEEEERESLPVVGTSRLPCSPGPIPLSRAPQLLIEVPPCSAVGMSLHSAHLPPRSYRTRRYGVLVCERGRFSTCSCSPVLSDTAGNGFDALPSEGQIVCHLPELPWAPGNDVFQRFSTVGGVIADWISGAGTLHVVAGDSFGTGKLRTHEGGFLVKHKWTVSPPGQVIRWCPSVTLIDRFRLRK